MTEVEHPRPTMRPSQPEADVLRRPPDRIPPQLTGYTYTEAAALRARDEERLLSLRLETSLACNLRCRYCCNDSGEPQGATLPLERQMELLKEAKELQAQSIVFIGGGEFLAHHDRWRPLLEVTVELGMVPVIFTNGLVIAEASDGSIARLLNQSHATVILKLDSLRPEVQDDLAGGRRGYSSEVREALRLLQENGFTSSPRAKELRLGASCVVTQENKHDLVDAWCFCRDNGLFPNIEWLVPHGRANLPENRCLLLSTAEIAELRETIHRLDSERYGYDWLKYTPRIGAGCLQLMYSLYVTHDGFVRPCAALWHHPLNVRDPQVCRLRAVRQNEFYRKARFVNEYLEGRCAKGVCPHNAYCYGCRGLTFADLLEENQTPEQALCGEDTSCPLCKGVTRPSSGAANARRETDA